jgi:MoaA/NifB/PqqE/SkfB family radical SAM enzyme
MGIRSNFREFLRPIYRNHTWLKEQLRSADTRLDLLRHSVADYIPQVIRADPRNLFITLTANCNLRCKACNYGRDFMPGHTLPLQIVKDLLDDAKTLGFERVRLYGGEPLLHKDLPEIVRHCSQLGLGFWMTTNGILLKQKIDALVDAGLNRLSVGFYGTGEEYNDYVQRKQRFREMEEGVAYVRERYGMSVFMHLDWLLMKPTCSQESIHQTLAFSEKYAMPVYANLLHYSLPYFTDGKDPELHLGSEDRSQIEMVVNELLQFRERRPELVLNTVPGLRSIPDWLIKGPAMRVPCTEYRLIWIGADGTVQMCYVTFKLGNLHEKRLSEILMTSEHHKSARDAFQLNCHN